MHTPFREGEKEPYTMQQKLCNDYLLDTEGNAYLILFICYIELCFVTGYRNLELFLKEIKAF